MTYVRHTEELTIEECLAQLKTHQFGRIAVKGPEGMAIFPVNYFFSNGHIAIRTDPGTKLSAAVQSQVAFEIDEVDELTRTGWSVLVKGTAYEVTDSVDEESRAIRDLPVDPWAGDKSRWLRIEPEAITGRTVRTRQI